MARDPQQEGLYNKFQVKRTYDPTGKHDNCWYFVLDIKHDPIARTALQAYARAALDAGYIELSDRLKLKLEEIT